MNKKLIRILLTVVLLLAAWLVEQHASLPLWQLLLVYMVPYAVISYDVLGEALEGIMNKDPFDEDLLMAIATIGALCIGFIPGAKPEFMEAVFVMLFFQLGEYFEDFAEDKARDSIGKMMDLRPDTAFVERDGTVTEVRPDTIRVGEVIVVKPGEKIPLDGIVQNGASTLNTVALTGESLPRKVGISDAVISGSVNLSGVIKIKTTKTFGDSTASKILELVENAGENKSRSESFIRRFARVYTPIVVVAALILAFVPPLFYADYGTALGIWLYRALTFLVVSCPCALVISIPLTFFAGIGGASHKGILIKGGNYMDVLSKLHTVVFDKTGTLTHGNFEVTAVHPSVITETELLHLAAHVERFSTHPIAIALRNAYPGEADSCRIADIKEVAGQGISALVNGKTVAVGNEKLMNALGIDIEPCEKCALSTGTTVHIAINGVYAGHIVIADKMKGDVPDAMKSLKTAGVKQLVMLTGDHKTVAEEVARKAGLDAFYAELMPADKVAHLERLLKEQPEHGKLAFVGDGMNDAPVLARADVGIAMGGLGSDAAIEAADVVLMDDKPSKIATAVRISRRTISIARQNAVFAIGIKVAVLLLAGIGVASMGLAVFADVGVMILAVLNAMRALQQ